VAASHHDLPHRQSSSVRVSDTLPRRRTSQNQYTCIVCIHFTLRTCLLVYALKTARSCLPPRLGGTTQRRRRRVPLRRTRLLRGPYRTRSAASRSRSPSTLSAPPRSSTRPQARTHSALCRRLFRLRPGSATARMRRGCQCAIAEVGGRRAAAGRGGEAGAPRGDQGVVADGGRACRQASEQARVSSGGLADI
jgi:hypothetical protein